MTTHTDIDLAAKPTTGQRTKAQAQSSNLTLPGFGIPPSSTYALYREMRKDPIVSIGMAAATAPIIASSWNFQSKKAPAGAKKLIKENLDKIKPWLVEQAMLALQFGWQPFEKVWVKESGKFIIHRLKPLLQDKTQIIVDSQTGAFIGLQADRENSLFLTPDSRGGVFLPPEKSFVYTHMTDPFVGLYGTSRFEAIKLDWLAASKTREKQSQFQDKVSSVLFLLEYPEGTSTDKSGAEIDNDVAAKRLMDDLRSGNAVAIPNTLHPMHEDWIPLGVTNPEILKAWRITLLETASGHQAEFVTTRTDFDKRILRGLLVPERSIIEGLGSSAESESHNNVGLLMAEQTNREWIRQVNAYLVDNILAVNWGLEAIGTVWIEPEPISEEKKQLQKEIVRMTYGSANADLTKTDLDMAKMLDNTGIPQLSVSKPPNSAEKDKLAGPNPNEGFPQEPRTNRQDVEQDTNRGSNVKP